MKKVLFVTLAMAVAMTGFAQRATVNPAAKTATVTVQKRSAERISDGSAVQGVQFTMPEHMTQTSRDFESFETMITNYDLQSNSALGNRIAVWPDGSASFVATWDNSGETSFPDRGAGYNFYNAEEGTINDMPTERQESVKSGWPTIAACGDGEVMASHATGVNLYYRPTRGEGEWELIYNWGNDYGAPTWPRVVVSGPNNEFIHLVMCKQINVGTSANPVYDNHVYYVRVKHVGDTWEIPEELNDMPLIDNDFDGEYRNQFSADDYVMAANGNNVAILLGSYTAEVVYIISHDNGETWEKQVVLPWPEPNAHAHNFDDFPSGCVGDTLVASDNSHSIAIDNNGTVHVVFGLFRWMQTEADRYTYWPAYRYGIVYWNSNYTNEQGGHEIPLYGNWSEDANHPEWSLGLSGIGESFQIERIDALCEADGHRNLHWCGYVDEDGDGEINFPSITGATWSYRSDGLATMPTISVDNLGNMAITYSVWSEIRICEATQHSYRSVYATLRDNGGTWFDDVVNLTGDFMLQYTEAYPCVASPVAYNGSFWMYFSGDENQGLYLDISDSYPDSNLGVLTDNTIYAVKITPDKDMPGLETWGVDNHEAVNPMTAVRVYPNPATDVLNIEVNASQSSNMSINVFNIMGQKVMESNVNVNAGINCPSISTSELSSGIYFVTVKANGFENTMKFIVK